MSEQGMNRRQLLASAAAVGGLSMGLSLVPTGASAASSAANRGRRAEATWENIIEKSSFSSSTAFNKEWNHLYPWDGGADMHNGAARMHAGQVSLAQGVLTLTATRLAAPDGNSTHSPYAPLWYRSGAVHAKEQILINDQFPEYDIEGEFRTNTGQGIWPAFWTTGVWPAWPPESDILEYVGDSTNLFNTRNSDGNGGEIVERETVSGHDPDAWHKYRVWMTKEGDDVLVDYYFDGVWKATHRGVGWAGIPQSLIINLQMGSWASGIEPGDPGWDEQPGPAADTYFRARNVWVGRTRAW
ncbi:glycoside hydrolase family 16 protein [Streptosporangium lutulentum]|uniref:Beta-glucanase (GH16 family) n=1 Tax=Streptosporangium lutulentum TaxID=1461250 RepID=A0ABT9QPF6_9ACTN|nr:family 16 glycosylhydrolase [Streptosporangium lutulentum]MDP9848642.1 beta-glucanase (GH16 family) [Streptosporangium lutulentum]